MPYITTYNKDKFTSNADDNGVATYLEELDLGNFVGHLNYLNYKIVKRYIQKNGNKYFTFCAVVGTLICCVLEIYRRLVAPYEDKKIKENGDVE